MEWPVNSRAVGAARTTAPLRATPRRSAGPSGPEREESASTAAVLGLQRSAGNRAVSAALGGRLAVQRTDLYVYGGGHLSSADGAGTNEAKPVKLVQDRLIAMGALTEADAAADRARIKAQTGRIRSADIVKTLAAIDSCDTPELTEPAAKKVLKVDLVAGVGQGQTNDAADAELVLNLLHEEAQVTNADYDASIVVLRGIGHNVDPAKMPGFLAGLSKLKRGFAGGYPFRGSTRRRKGLLVTEGTADYQRALDYNTAGRALMQKWLDEAAGQSRDLVLRNSAQWCMSGRAKVFCQTKTHDSASRVRAEHQPSRYEAVFGYPDGPLGSPQVPYVRKLRGETAYDNTNVEIKPREGGSAGDGEILVNDPRSAGRSFFRDTIRHEVQHSADHQVDTDEGNYKTEINARWLEQRFAGYSTRRRVTRLGHTWNERQFAAFMDLWTHPDLYPYLRKNWNATDRTERDRWRTMVVGYTKPETFNPINSVRIETLNDALWNIWTADCDADDKFREGKGPENAKATAVKKAMSDLDALDRTTIKSNAELKARADVHLTGKLHDDWKALL